jgi:hypothetical protein
MLAARWDAINYTNFPVVSLRWAAGYMLPCLRHENHQTRQVNREMKA